MTTKGTPPVSKADAPAVAARGRSRRALGLASRVLRALLDALVSLGIVLALALVGLYYICNNEPRLITAWVEQYLTDVTGMPWQLNGAVSPVFSPYPGLRVADVRIPAASTELSSYASLDKPFVEVRELSLFLEPAALESFSLRIRNIELESPIINFAYDAKKRPLWIVPDKLAESFEENVDEEISPNGSMHPDDATPSATAPDDAAPSPDPLRTAADTLCLLPEAIGLPLSIKNGSLRSWADDGSLLLSFQGFDGSFDPHVLEENLQLLSTFTLPGADLTLAFSLTATVGYQGIPARGRITGRLRMSPPGARAIVGEFASPFLWTVDGRRVLLPEFRFQSEGDTLTADLTADLAEASCTGTVKLNTISLTRWFEFGRKLPPGLREALHNLVCEFDLILDRNRAEARNLRGTAGTLGVSGYVGTPDFTKPVVVVDLSLQEANVDSLFPFLAAVGRDVPDPTPPVFDHPPLVPYPEDPAGPPPPPGPARVSYDIRIKVDKPSVHDVTGGPLLVTVLPVTVRGVAKTRVGIDAKNMIKGSITGYIDIDDHSMEMRYEPRNLELALLPENALNPVKIAGRVTGQCDISIPFKKNGDLADDWGLKADAQISACEITGSYKQSPWKLHFTRLKVDGKGSIHAVQPNGVRIEGLFDLAGAGIHTSWFPKGKDGINATFDGGLYWLPIHGKKGERRGVNKVAGKVNAKGSLIVPIGELRPPLTGQMQSDLEWMLYDDKLALTRTSFEGFKSVVKGDLRIDYSGKDVLITGLPVFTMSPRDFLKGWDLLVSESATLPRVVTGRCNVVGSGNSLRFDGIKADVDGRTYTGEIFWAESKRRGDPGLWTFRLATNFLDVDKFIAPPDDLPPGVRPPPPSKKPWNLKPFRNLALDVQLTAQRGRRDKLNLSKIKVTGALQRDRFTMLGETGDFYGGKSTIILQGSIVPEKSLVTLRKGLAEVNNADLGRLFRDMSGDTSYGGLADLIIDLSGHMTCDADLPARLSGAWKLAIKEGLYPGFMTRESSRVRNTFSSAAASGEIDRGVLRSNNFTLTGPMVDISGAGWFDLTSKQYDIEVSATFAKVPTVPIRLTGSVYDPKTQVQGAGMVVETVQNAGSTVFGLVKGVLMLPGYALRGLGNLVSKDDKENAAPKPSVAPHRHQTGHPGQ